MELTYAAYRDKVMGCFNGKNAGGTLGAPFECRRGVFDLTFYTQDLHGEPIPNDDLDLQLVWLNAAERYGRQVNGTVLGEYWIQYITPHWGEYGAGKNNLRAGILPPLSGAVNNRYKDSCGCFILSEIWACLAPGHPEIAVQYAFEDGCVNHADEGLYAEIFCAALESAAFAQPDAQALLDIGLSYIPADCGVARGVRCVREAYRSGADWRAARKRLMREVPGSFGAMGTRREDMAPDEPVGEIGWDAPSNIAIVALGLLYGEGDFGRSLCLAAGCGEDADCTAGTLGALLGIMQGNRALPEPWLEPLGGKIKTLCINRADLGLRIPDTIDGLTERVTRLMPVFLGPDLCDTTGTGGYRIAMREPDELACMPEPVNAWYQRDFAGRLAESPCTVTQETAIFRLSLRYDGDPFITPGTEKRFRLTVENRILMQQWITIRWILPDGFSITPGAVLSDSLEQFYCEIGINQYDFTLRVPEKTEGVEELILSVSSLGHPTRGLLPVLLYTRTGRYNDGK